MNDNFVNPKRDPGIKFIVIFLLLTKYFNSNEIWEGFERLCKNGFSVLQVSIRNINKHFETFKHFYSTPDSKLSVNCFLETRATNNLIENYSVYIQVINLREEED